MQTIFDVTWIFLMNEPVHLGMAILSMACGVYLGIMQSTAVKAWTVGLISCIILALFSGWVVYNKKSEPFLSMMQNKSGELKVFSEGSDIFIIRETVTSTIKSEITSGPQANMPLTERAKMRQITIQRSVLESLHAYYTIRHPSTRWPSDSAMEYLGLKVATKPEPKPVVTPTAPQTVFVAPSTAEQQAPSASSQSIESVTAAVAPKSLDTATSAISQESTQEVNATPTPSPVTEITKQETTTESVAGAPAP